MLTVPGEMSDVEVRGILRTEEAPASSLNLNAPEVSDEMLLDAMTGHPQLINRPIVVTDRRTLLCRPAERVEELLFFD